ncbi:MAG: type II toxin-antitoxin system RelE/ParE family toxin [Planctomycetes bacterium]|nr:type II toxin-antitoxin system RelE/ParE family toxin [Planctomycetota bacterium]
MPIVSFGDPVTADLFHGRGGARARRVPPDVARAVVRKLDVLNAVRALAELRHSPGNRLEALRGDRAGYHSIRVNDQWRIVFRWTEPGPELVSLVDYH